MSLQYAHVWVSYVSMVLYSAYIYIYIYIYLYIYRISFPVHLATLACVKMRGMVGEILREVLAKKNIPHTHTYIHIYICTYIHIYIYLRYIYIYIYICLYMQYVFEILLTCYDKNCYNAAFIYHGFQYNPWLIMTVFHNCVNLVCAIQYING